MLLDPTGVALLRSYENLRHIKCKEDGWEQEGF